LAVLGAAVADRTELVVGFYLFGDEGGAQHVAQVDDDCDERLLPWLSVEVLHVRA
jgi:hypothetical protein